MRQLLPCGTLLIARLRLALPLTVALACQGWGGVSTSAGAADECEHAEDCGEGEYCYERECKAKRELGEPCDGPGEGCFSGACGRVNRKEVCVDACSKDDIP